ncbi:MAG TPA: MraY family glycosyltransferase, partial [Phycisphaerae bacterium]|nr:MraY family glycosyltransferase [Phycisphaerae bacterium]
MKTYVAVYFGAALIAMILTPILSRIAKARGIVDAPGVRKVHDRPIPRIGGLAILVATLSLVLGVLWLHNTVGEAFRRVHRELFALLLGGSVMYVVGLVDDLRSVRAGIKLACLLGASLLVCLSGARFQDIQVGTWLDLNLGWTSWPITVIWIAGITVGFNFIDGLDGLAAGIAAIVCGSIAAFAAYTGQGVMLVLMLALLGSLTGFLFFNFNPARIFMGDGGSMFVGFIIAAGSVVCQAKTHTLAGIGLPVLALGVPIFDTAFTMIRRRVLDRRSLLAAERGHIHHRLLDRGLRHPTAVIVIYGITLVSAGIGILMMAVREGLVICLLAGGLLFLLAAFSLIGSARFRDTVAAVRRNRIIAHQVKRE